MNRTQKHNWEINQLASYVLKDSQALSSLMQLKDSSHLTCCQDEVPVPGHFDGGRHCGHLKVLNELNPALDV